MKNKLHWKKRMITFAAAAVLTVGGTIYGSSVTAWATPASGVSVGDNVVVRQSAVDGAQIGSLTSGQAVTIEDETTGSDGYTWYQISFTSNGYGQVGWVRSDLLSTSDESLETEETGSEGTVTTTTGDEESVSLVFETESGAITLTDIPEEELALVSDRFVETSLDFSEGTITALQLAEPDELVADDASIVDFYYVYGSNEIGETGWYVYNVDDGTIQKSLLNMQYSISDTEEEESDAGTAFEIDSLTRMLISALGVICLLLLILAIAFSVRYRRLRRILEEELDEEDYEKPAAAVKKNEEPKQGEKKRKKKKQEPEPAKVNKGQKPKEPVRAKEQASKPAQEKELYDAEEYGKSAGYSANEEYGQQAGYSSEEVNGPDAELTAEDVCGRHAENLTGDAIGRTSEPETAAETGSVKKSEKTAAEDKKQTVRENDVPEKRKKKAKKQNSVKMEEITPEPTTEVMGVDIMDLDSMDDTDYETLLNRYLEEDLAAVGEDADDDNFFGERMEQRASAEEKSAAESASSEKLKKSDDDYDIPPEEGADYDITDTVESDIIDLSKLRMPDEEPEFYDDEDDDDLTFL